MPHPHWQAKAPAPPFMKRQRIMMVLMDPRRMCPHCRAFITIKDRVCPYCNEAVAPRQVPRNVSSEKVDGRIPHFRFNSTIILLLNFELYIPTTTFSMPGVNTD